MCAVCIYIDVSWTLMHHNSSLYLTFFRLLKSFIKKHKYLSFFLSLFSLKMDARIDEIKSKLCTALSNGNTVDAAYKHAITSGLEDNVFQARTTRILGLLETSTMTARHWLNKFYGPDFPQFITMVVEQQADEALKESEMALKLMQAAVTAATERKKAREEEGKTKENEDCEEPGKKKARKTTKEGEASNNPGGSNA